jgi:hypothetical protein
MKSNEYKNINYWFYNAHIAPPFLTSALDRGEWLASRHHRFTPREKYPVSNVQEAG